MALLEAQNLSVHFGGLAAVKHVTFGIEPGERLALIGPNGAGKTTLFNLLTGQLKPSGGKVLFKGQDITNASGVLADPPGHVPLLPDHQPVPVAERHGQRHDRAAGSGEEPVRVLPAAVQGRASPTAAQELLESADLWDLKDEIVSSLAYGQQRKLEIALSLASQPDLLLLDEPSCGLTTVESADITKRIRELGSKITVLMIAHDMDLVFGVAERVILLHYGEIACEGTCDEIRANHHGQGDLHGQPQATGGR